MVFIPHWPKVYRNKLIEKDYTLNRIKDFLHALGDPQDKLPPIIHIAGTNGKGSTATFIQEICSQAGYKAHKLISPHLFEFNERITLANKHISDQYLYDILEYCRCISIKTGIQPSFFEGTTAAAFYAFAEVDADIVILETGMGGKLDATNIIKDSIMSVITSISFDHTEYLGLTIEEIANHKAGILKNDRLCIVAKQEYINARKIIEAHAIKKRAPVFRNNFEWKAESNGNKLQFTANNETVEFEEPSLKGQHQIDNAGTAIAVATMLNNKFKFKIEHDHINKAMLSTYWPARLEKIEYKTILRILPKKWNLYLDGAHNAGGSKIIANWIDQYKKNQDVYIIFGTTIGKDIKDFLRIFKGKIKFLACICIKSEPRAETAEEVHRIAKELQLKSAPYRSINDAIKSIIAMGEQNRDSTIITCGSLFLAKELKETIENI